MPPAAGWQNHIPNKLQQKSRYHYGTCLFVVCQHVQKLLIKKKSCIPESLQQNQGTRSCVKGSITSLHIGKDMRPLTQENHSDCDTRVG